MTKVVLEQKLIVKETVRLHKNNGLINVLAYIVIKDKEKQKVIGMHKRKVLGNLSYDKIRINNVDWFCSKLRARVVCFVRETRNFAKRRKQIGNLLHITQTNHNFIEADNGVTPGMREGIIDKVLSWNDVFDMR